MVIQGSIGTKVFKNDVLVYGFPLLDYHHNSIYMLLVQFRLVGVCWSVLEYVGVCWCMLVQFSRGRIIKINRMQVNLQTGCPNKF